MLSFHRENIVNILTCHEIQQKWSSYSQAIRWHFVRSVTVLPSFYFKKEKREMSCLFRYNFHIKWQLINRARIYNIYPLKKKKKLKWKQQSWLKIYSYIYSCDKFSLNVLHSLSGLLSCCYAKVKVSFWSFLLRWPVRVVSLTARPAAKFCSWKKLQQG